MLRQLISQQQRMKTAATTGELSICKRTRALQRLFLKPGNGRIGCCTQATCSHQNSSLLPSRLGLRSQKTHCKMPGNAVLPGISITELLAGKASTSQGMFCPGACGPSGNVSAKLACTELESPEARPGLCYPLAACP